MPKDERKCRMYIARVTFRRAKRLAARELSVRIKNRLDNKKGRVNNRRLFSLQTIAPLIQRGNPFAGNRKHRVDGWLRAEKLKARYAGVTA